MIKKSSNGFKSRLTAALMAATVLANNIMVSSASITDSLAKRATGISDSRKALQEQFMEDKMAERDAEGYVSVRFINSV